MLEAWSRAVTVKMDISGFEIHVTVLDLTEFDDKYIMKGNIKNTNRSHCGSVFGLP